MSICLPVCRVLILQQNDARKDHKIFIDAYEIRTGSPRTRSLNDSGQYMTLKWPWVDILRQILFSRRSSRALSSGLRRQLRESKWRYTYHLAPEMYARDSSFWQCKLYVDVIRRASLERRRQTTVRCFKFNPTARVRHTKRAACMHVGLAYLFAVCNKKAVLSQGNRAMPQLFFSV